MLVVGASREEAIVRADVAVKRIRFATADAGATRLDQRPPAKEAAGFGVAATLLVTALAVAYIVSKIDIRTCLEILRDASIRWLALSAFLTVITVPPQAWRWQLCSRRAASSTRLPG